MISSDQTQPTVKHWVTCFRNDEKQIYGANKLSQPLQINSDRAMVFVITAMEVFNNENLLGFLKISWKILHGHASVEELKITMVHTSAFHFMKNSKEIVKKHCQYQIGKSECGFFHF